MKLLFLHGWQSVVGGVKPSFLAAQGHEVLNPALPDEDFDAAVAIAQRLVDDRAPQVIVGSSRGGAVAMNLLAPETPRVLLCPGWRRWGRARTVPMWTRVLHSRADEVIPFADSQQLVAASGLPESALIEVGHDHRLADPDALTAMLAACENLADASPQGKRC